MKLQKSPIIADLFVSVFLTNAPKQAGQINTKDYGPH